MGVAEVDQRRTKCNLGNTHGQLRRLRALARAQQSPANVAMRFQLGIAPPFSFEVGCAANSGLRHHIPPFDTAGLLYAIG